MACEFFDATVKYVFAFESVRIGTLDAFKKIFYYGGKSEGNSAIAAEGNNHTAGLHNDGMGLAL